MLSYSIQYLADATPARKVVVQAALRYLNELSKDAPGSVSLQDEIATAYEKVGDAQGGTGSANLGDTAGALESYRKALAIRQAIYAATPSDPTACEGLSRSWLRIGGILQDVGRYQEALQYHRQHLELSRRLALASPADLKAQTRLARSSDAMGDVLVSLSQWDESLKNYEASSAIFKQLAVSEPQLRTHKNNWALERKKIGGVFEARQPLSRALQEYRSALAVDEEPAKSSPQDASLSATWRSTTAISAMPSPGAATPQRPSRIITVQSQSTSGWPPPTQRTPRRPTISFTIRIGLATRCLKPRTSTRQSTPIEARLRKPRATPAPIRKMP